MRLMRQGHLSGRTKRNETRERDASVDVRGRTRVLPRGGSTLASTNAHACVSRLEASRVCCLWRGGGEAGNGFRSFRGREKKSRSFERFSRRERKSLARPAMLAKRCPLSEKYRAPILLRAKSQNRPSSPSSVLRAHAPRAMAVDVEAARRLAPGKKERAKPAKAKSGLWKTEGDAPSGKEKPARSFAKASRSSSADPKRAPQKPARGSGKPPRAPRDAKKGAEDASARRASTPPLGVSPNELVAGLAGSLAMCVVSGVSKLVRRKLGGRACVAKKDPEGMDLSAEARDARLDAVKAELRDALEQLREQRKSMDHLRKQNQAFVRENQLLKVAHANANANAETRASAAKHFDGDPLSSQSGSPSGPLSRRASPARSAPASPEADAESRESQDAIIARLLSPLDADADEAARVSKTPVSYTHLTPADDLACRSRWSPYH